MSQKFSHNLWKIIYQFLGKTPITARSFFKFLHNFFMAHISDHFFQYSPKTVFRTFSTSGMTLNMYTTNSKQKLKKKYIFKTEPVEIKCGFPPENYPYVMDTFLIIYSEYLSSGPRITSAGNAFACNMQSRSPHTGTRWHYATHLHTYRPALFHESEQQRRDTTYPTNFYSFFRQENFRNRTDGTREFPKKRYRKSPRNVSPFRASGTALFSDFFLFFLNPFLFLFIFCIIFFFYL